MPTISPDGRQVAVISERSGGGEVWLHPLDGGDARQLTRIGAPIQTVGWSQDGSTIVLSDRKRGTYDVMAVDVASGTATALTDDDRYEVNPVVTPGGRHVVFLRLDERWVDHEVVRIPLARGEREVAHGRPRHVRLPLWPDVRAAVPLAGRRDDRLPVPPVGLAQLLGRARGGEAHPLAPDDGHQLGFTWSPDGSRAAITRNHDGTVSLVVLDVADGSVRTLLDPGTGLVENPQFSPDGMRISCLLSTPMRGSAAFRSRRACTAPG